MATRIAQIGGVFSHCRLISISLSITPAWIISLNAPIARHTHVTNFLASRREPEHHTIGFDLPALPLHQNHRWLAA
jgi:hypothetical protein